MFEEFVQAKPDHPAVVSAMYWIGKARAKEGKVRGGEGLPGREPEEVHRRSRSAKPWSNCSSNSRSSARSAPTAPARSAGLRARRRGDPQSPAHQPRPASTGTDARDPASAVRRFRGTRQAARSARRHHQRDDQGAAALREGGAGEADQEAGRCGQDPAKWRSGLSRRISVRCLLALIGDFLLLSEAMSRRPRVLTRG